MSIAHHSKLLLHFLLPHCTLHSQYYGEQPLCIHSVHFVEFSHVVGVYISFMVLRC